MSHLVESGMDYLVIHAKHINVVKKPLHPGLELRQGLAINVAGPAFRRCKDLTLERRHADDQGAMWLECCNDIGKKAEFAVGSDMFEHVERVDPVKMSHDWTGEQVMHEHFRETPAVDGTRLDVLDE